MVYIYQIKNLINNKIYIGSTIRPLYKRKYEHFSELRNNEHCNTYLQRSFNKYGEENFSFTILETLKFPKEYSKLLISEYLVCRELYLVNLFNAAYNIRKETTTGNTGYNHSEENKDKIRNSRIDKNPSKNLLHQRELKRRRQLGLVNKVGRVKGSKLSDKEIEIIRERSLQEKNIKHMTELQKESAKSRIGLHHSNTSKIQMMIHKFGKMRQIEIYKGNLLVDICNFSPEASILTGVKRAAISNNLAGLSKSAGGYTFNYKNI